MTQYKARDDGGIEIIAGRKSWAVDIPAHAYDLWMPVTGLRPIGVYGLLWRLARDNVTAMGIKKLCRAARMGDRAFMGDCRDMVRWGWLKILTPSEELRRAGKPTKFIILDIPSSVPAEIIERELEGRPYLPLCPWLVEKSDDGYREISPDEVEETIGEVSPNEDTLSSDEDTVSPNEDFIDPSLDPSLESIRDKQAKPVVSAGLSDEDKAFLAGLEGEDDDEAIHDLVAAIYQFSGSKQLTPQQLTVLGAPVTWFNPDTKKQETLHTSKYVMWDADADWREFLVDVAFPRAAGKRDHGKASRTTLLGNINNIGWYMDWRKASSKTGTGSTSAKVNVVVSVVKAVGASRSEGGFQYED